MLNLSDPWAGWAALAEILVAMGTAILAFATFRLASQSRDLNKKTQELALNAEKEVEASLRSAKATEALALEARLDRQYMWQPHLELRDTSHGDTHWTLKVKNTGAGPAFNVVVVAREMSNIGIWTILRFGDLVSGEEKQLTQENWQHGMSLSSPFDGYQDLGDRHAVTTAMMCSDVLARRFRFGVATPKNPFPGEPTKILPVDIFPTSTNQPVHVGWAWEPLIWT